MNLTYYIGARVFDNPRFLETVGKAKPYTAATLAAAVARAARWIERPEATRAAG